jgi:peroxisomal membrane protein 4
VLPCSSFSPCNYRNSSIPRLQAEDSKWTTSRQSRYVHRGETTRNKLTDIPFQGEIEKIILNPKYHQPLVLVKAIRNGLVYGTKVRLPHALVMIFLFRSGTIREKLLAIFKATKLHAFNLAKFAFLYKSSMLAMKNVNGKEQSVHPFIAGLFGGYWVFGHGKAAFSSVSQQIVIYVFARVVLGMAKLAVQPPGNNTLVGGTYGGHGGKGIFGLSEEQLAIVRKRSWPVFASLSWASVMWLFRWYPEMLQPSLRNSMTYMYVERSLIPFFSSCSSANERLRDPSRHYSPTDTGLTSTFSCPDTTTRTHGTAWVISFGTTNDTCTIMTSFFGYPIVNSLVNCCFVFCCMCHRTWLLLARLTFAFSFANSEHWSDLNSFVMQHTPTALPPGLPGKLD